MTWLLVSLGIFVGGGLAALMFWRHPRISAGLGVGSALAGSLAAAGTGLRVLISGVTQSSLPGFLRKLDFPALYIDQLAALFLLVIALLGFFASIYGWGYFAHDRRRVRTAFFRFCWNLLLAGMILVVTSAQAILFLIAWELMTLASFFLVLHEGEAPASRRAGWTYLIATHIGTSFLLAMFVILGGAAGSLDFRHFTAVLSRGAVSPNLVFVLALVGFGTKAGFFPLHVWLPEAHPAAPSPVSALMSGVMIKTGIYALFRLFSMLPQPPPFWWGTVLIALGGVSALAGVIYALAQQNLKRLLAYSSVENMGIIALGIGMGLLGWSRGEALIMIAGFGGGLLHLLNHSLCKGLLFIGAGSVQHAAGTLSIDRLGGLYRFLPRTGLAFLAGSAAISGLPPFGMFASEFLICFAALKGLLQPSLGLAVPALVLLVTITLTGGLAVVCFTKAAGLVFLGETRDPELSPVKEKDRRLSVPPLILIAGSAMLGLAAPLVFPVLGKVVAAVIGGPLSDSLLLPSLRWIAALMALIWLMMGLTFLIRRGGKKREKSTVTWDCGYIRPDARMQYTGSSFVQPVTSTLDPLLRATHRVKLPQGFFPQAGEFFSQTGDAARENFYQPLFSMFARVFGKLNAIQEGRVQVYVLYIALALLVLLIFAV